MPHVRIIPCVRLSDKVSGGKISFFKQKGWSDSGDFSGIFGDIRGFKGAISPPHKKPNFDRYAKLCRPMCSGDRDLSDNIQHL